MKALFLILTLSALSLQAIYADWVIVQKTVTDGKADEMIIKAKGSKTRTDIGTKMSLISDSTTGDIITLMHEQKILMKMNPDSMKGLMAMAGSLLNKNEPPAKPTATGKMEKVGTYDTEIYTWSSKLGSGKFWVAKNFADFQELNSMQDKLMKSMANPLATLVPQNSDFPGMVVKSEISIMGKTAISELISAKKDPVDDAVFIAPEGYQEMKMPSLPGK